jgi:hypothetical protein
VGPQLNDANRLASAEATGTKPQADPAPVTTGPRDLDLGPVNTGGGTSGGNGGGGWHGGGAFDPISGTIVAALAGLGFATRRPRRKNQAGNAE